MNSVLVTLALLGGFIPALFWLWFWLREDKARPEPRTLIFTAFIAGIAVVPIALVLQKNASEHFTGQNLLFIFVIIEEVLKYSAALLVVLWNKAVDEPIDCIIYMITIALGFAALENALFIFNPLSEGLIQDSIMSGQFRFLGPTLLHVLASGTVGVMMALAFYKRKVLRILFATIGLSMAIVLHVLYNFFIMETQGRGEATLGIFLVVWMCIIVLFLIFEKVKLIESN